MNLVGKIFIVLIFVMSILFMGFVVAVYAAHTNWRELVKNPDTGLEKQLKDKQLELERLTNQMTKTEQDLANETHAIKMANAALEEEKKLLTQERDQLQSDYDTQSNLARDAVAAMEKAHDTLAGLRDEVGRLDASLLAANKMRDDSITSLIAKTDDANSKAIELQTLQKKATQIAEQLTDAMEVLRQFKLTAAPDRYRDTPPQGVEGLVSRVIGDWVEISVGSDDGLLVGHRLDAFRGGTYLGKIEVTRVDPDRAVCKVVPEFRKGMIQANDRVSTGLQSQ